MGGFGWFSVGNAAFAAGNGVLSVVNAMEGNSVTSAFSAACAGFGLANAFWAATFEVFPPYKHPNPPDNNVAQFHRHRDPR